MGSHGQKIRKVFTVTRKHGVEEKELPFKEGVLSFVHDPFNQHLSSEVETSLNWYDGCLTFTDTSDYSEITYNHCGAECGDRGAYGGGYKVNSLDGCCYAHDNCYSAFGSNDCGCDQDLADWNMTETLVIGRFIHGLAINFVTKLKRTCGIK
ncbi:hypothetical protein MJ3_09723 [Salimicrobium jeotgali]|uniref:Phospholipase A2 domain-containing protein n=1 Tax=Salimicrobium jeotgali TaxID=1230341 RepID=K2GLI7_9BACI|nr:hypothetical protein MJ3_09723 [Salimicrobium jeotgali]